MKERHNNEHLVDVIWDIIESMVGERLQSVESRLSQISAKMQYMDHNFNLSTNLLTSQVDKQVMVLK